MGEPIPPASCGDRILRRRARGRASRRATSSTGLLAEVEMAALPSAHRRCRRHPAVPDAAPAIAPTRGRRCDADVGGRAPGRVDRTPLGELTIVCSAKGVVATIFEDEDRDLGRWPWPASTGVRAIAAGSPGTGALGRLGRATGDPGLLRRPHASLLGAARSATGRREGFGRRVLEAVTTIPYGELWTYGDVAGMAGSPRAATGRRQRARGMPDRALRAVPSRGARRRHDRRLRAPRGPQALAAASRGRDAPDPDVRAPVREDGGDDPSPPARRRLPRDDRCRLHERRRDRSRADADGAPPSASALAAQVASSDLAADSPEAVQIGVFSSTPTRPESDSSPSARSMSPSASSAPAGSGPPADRARDGGTVRARPGRRSRLG